MIVVLSLALENAIENTLVFVICSGRWMDCNGFGIYFEICTYFLTKKIFHLHF